jgi:hypothetical protein
MRAQLITQSGGAERETLHSPLSTALNFVVHDVFIGTLLGFRPSMRGGAIMCDFALCSVPLVITLKPPNEFLWLILFVSHETSLNFQEATGANESARRRKLISLQHFPAKRGLSWLRFIKRCTET